MHTLFVVGSVVVSALLLAATYHIGSLYAREALAAAHKAHESSMKADGHEFRLKALRADVLAASNALQALEGQVSRISGRVYATSRRPEALEQIERDNIAAHLKRSDDPRARLIGETHERMGVGIAAPSSKACTCGWCATCTMGPVVTN